MSTLPLLDLSLPGTAARGSARRVNAFLLSSVVMHGLALLGLIAIGEFFPPSDLRLRQNELQLVQLDAPHAAIAPASTPTATPSPRVTRALQRTVPAKPAQEANSTLPAAVQPPAQETAPAHDITTADATALDAATSTAIATPAQSLADSKALILSYLHLTLNAQKVYPPLAVRHGWQGDVSLAFHVDPTGAIQNVHVTHSSGYAALDQSAINALRRVGNIPNAPQWLDGGMTDLELPVIYQLHEG